MKFIVLLLIALGLYLTPLYLFDSQVLPALQSLQVVYAGADQSAQDIAATRQP